ncbi:uncharacterized protein TM35_000013020 [Trypanosoma theileri]|uniref:Uncharacterized protein n=1 Tax=Trypanosoma theileri TaxID=67003 RepID=A0A1X0P9C3_9TRYP|nr:uncharacterized protein TM35_000013020 [Trypanosoma theileri]ORC93425.1 hypothetical protein TM35_000013020 [Trypanosoma theileri]
MSDFDDNPLATDDDEGTTTPLEVTNRKREREEDVAMAAAPERSPPQMSVSTQRATCASSSSAVMADSHDSGVLTGEDFTFDGNEKATSIDIPTTESLLAEYDAGREEDEFNELIVKTAELESKLKKQKNTYNDEITRVSKEHKDLEESMESLKSTILRICEEIKSVQTTRDVTDIEGNNSNNKSSYTEDALGLMEVIQRENSTLNKTVKELTQHLNVQVGKDRIIKELTEHIYTCITGNQDGQRDILSIFDPQVERRNLELCKTAIAKLSTSGVIDQTSLLIQALMGVMNRLVNNFDVIYANAKTLNERMSCLSSSLRELARYSLEWYCRTINKDMLGNGDVKLPIFTSREAYEGSVGNQRLETTLHRMEYTVNQLLTLLPSNLGTTTPHQNTPAIAAAAAALFNEDLESHTEALGKEVLMLRKLLTEDTATLVPQLSELHKKQGEKKETDLKTSTTTEMTTWLIKIMKTLMERLNTANTLLHSLGTSEKSRDAPAMALQLAFYEKYLEMQKMLLHELHTCNTALQERAYLVTVIRQIALHDGDNEAVAMVAQKLVESLENNNINDNYEELEQRFIEKIKKFADEASEMFRDHSVSAVQSAQKLQEVRRFFAQTVEVSDKLVYGESSRSIPHSIAEISLINSSDVVDTSHEGNLLLCNSDEEFSILPVTSNDVRKELQEEINTVERRNKELMKCMKWFSTQKTHNAIPKLCAARKEVEELRQKLKQSEEGEAKWKTLKGEVDETRKAVSVAVAATAAMRDRLNGLRERLHTGKEGQLQ